MTRPLFERGLDRFQLFFDRFERLALRYFVEIRSSKIARKLEIVTLVTADVTESIELYSHTVTTEQISAIHTGETGYTWETDHYVHHTQGMN